MTCILSAYFLPRERLFEVSEVELLPDKEYKI